MPRSRPRDTGCDEKVFFLCVLRGENRRLNDGIRGVFVDGVDVWSILHAAWLKTHFPVQQFLLRLAGLMKGNTHAVQQPSQGYSSGESSVVP